MADDYYETLGVARNASQADIQKAYRNLARKYHPDLNPDDKSAKEKFQTVQRAFDVLNDPSKREMYDRYGSSFESMGAGGPQPGRGWSPQGSPEVGDIDFAQFFGERFGADPGGGFADIFKQFGRGGSAGGGRRRKSAAQTGEDVTQEFTIPFTTAVTGGKVQISVQRPSGKVDTLDVKIPAGIADGAKIRLRGQGNEGAHGGKPGDILLTIRIAPHAYYRRRDNDLTVRVPVTLAEAALGAKVDVPTPTGTVSVRIPAGTSSGKKLRLKGKGITPKTGEPGDLFVEVLIVLPEQLADETLTAIRNHEQDKPADPRRELAW